MAKIISNAAHFNEPIPDNQQTYVDVPRDNDFWVFVERITARGIVEGYNGNGEYNVCIDADEILDRRYYRPCYEVTRGQLAKYVSEGSGFEDDVNTQHTYADVPPGNPFHEFIERLKLRNAFVGLETPCTLPSEVSPLDLICGVSEYCDSQNRPFIKWCIPAKREEIAQLVAISFYPDCVTPLDAPQATVVTTPSPSLPPNGTNTPVYIPSPVQTVSVPWPTEYVPTISTPRPTQSAQASHTSVPTLTQPVPTLTPTTTQLATAVPTP